MAATSAAGFETSPATKPNVVPPVEESSDLSFEQPLRKEEVSKHPLLSTATVGASVNSLLGSLLQHLEYHTSSTDEPPLADQTTIFSIFVSGALLLCITLFWKPFGSRSSRARPPPLFSWEKGDQKMEVALVTGGQSSLGQHLIQQLLQKGHRVLSLGDCGIKGVESVSESRLDLSDVTVIFHLDLTCTQQVLQSCKAATSTIKLVLASDASELFSGARLTDMDESLPLPPAQTQAQAALLQAEQAVLGSECPSNVVACVLRGCGVFGADGSGKLGWMARIASWKMIMGRGLNLTDLTYVENMAYAAVLAGEQLIQNDRVQGEIFYVTNGEAVSMWKSVDAVAAGLGSTRPLVPMPVWVWRVGACVCESLCGVVNVGGAGVKPWLSWNDVSVGTRHCYFSCHKAFRILGYVPPVPLSTALPYALLHSPRLQRGSGTAAVARGVLQVVGVAGVVSGGLLWMGPARSLVAEVAVIALMLTVLWGVAPSRLQPPVMNSGLPLIGDLIAFVRGPIDMVHRARTRYRDCFSLNFGGQKVTFLMGPKAHATFIKGTDAELDQGAVYNFTVPVFGPGVVYDAPLKKRAQQVQFISGGMATSNMKTYVDMMVQESEMFFAKWPDEGTTDLLTEISELTIMTASRCLHGEEVRNHLFKEVADLYHSLDKGLTPLSVLWPRAPTAAHRERDRARKEMCKIFGRVIKERRMSGVKKDDILQVFMDSEYKDGSKTTDEEVTGLLIVLLFAGQHTSSITGTWLGMHILANKDKYMDKLMAEQAEVGAFDGGLDYSKLMGMKVMRAAISETLRLHPPLIFLMRKCLVDRHYNQYTIPKGHIVAVSPSIAGRDERTWRRPDTFMPERFLEGGEDASAWDSTNLHDRAAAEREHSFMSFGGGRHMCMGRRFGFLQMSTIMSVMLKHFDMEVMGPIPEPDYLQMVVGPSGPCMIKFKRKAKKAA